MTVGAIELAPVAVTMGEPAGVGVEIVLKSWLKYEQQQLPPFFLIGDPAHARAMAGLLHDEVPVVEIDEPEQAAAAIRRGLPVMPLALSAEVRPGHPDPLNAPHVIEAIDRAVAYTRIGAVSAVATAPIQKSVLYAIGFKFPGHTEYLAHLCGATEEPVMLLASPGVRAVPVTIHMALSEALSQLNADLIVRQSEITARALREDFGLPRPHLALAGLNPHAGEGGDLGREDIEIVAVAVQRLRDSGIEVSGPHAPDSMFHAKMRETYDAAICMYHDQALIPVKALGFDIGINITLGLPIVRTSPDHGTALALAGTGRANPASMISAIGTAGVIAHRRAKSAEHDGGA